MTPRFPPSPADTLGRLLRDFGIDVSHARLALVKVVLIWVLAWLGWQLVKAISRRMITHASAHDASTRAQHEQRAQTVSQLMHSAGWVLILILAVFLSLNQFIDIGPLMGGAAVLGLAVSFGAQSMVKDFLTGFFILMEDQFGLGDVIAIAGKSGTVERMTLRMTVLRDLDGTVHVVPNGQITSVSNHTRGWSRAIVDITIRNNRDLDAAMALLREEALQLATDTAWASKFDAPPEVTGVQSLDEDSVAIRTMLRTQPGMQWEVGREFRRRVKLRLDREGIHSLEHHDEIKVPHTGEMPVPAPPPDPPPVSIPPLGVE